MFHSGCVRRLICELCRWTGVWIDWSCSFLFCAFLKPSRPLHASPCNAFHSIDSVCHYSTSGRGWPETTSSPQDISLQPIHSTKLHVCTSRTSQMHSSQLHKQTFDMYGRDTPRHQKCAEQLADPACLRQHHSPCTPAQVLLHQHHNRARGPRPHYCTFLKSNFPRGICSQSRCSRTDILVPALCVPVYSSRPAPTGKTWMARSWWDPGT